MARFYSDDPVRDAEDYMNYLDDLADDLPICSECNEKIMDDEAYFIFDYWICEDCMRKYKRETYGGSY